MKNRDLIAQKIRGKQIVSYNLQHFVNVAPDLEQCITKSPSFESPYQPSQPERYEHSADHSLKLVPGAAVFIYHEELPSLVTEKIADDTFFVMQYQHQCNSYNLSYKNLNMRNKLSVSAIKPDHPEICSHEQGLFKNVKIVMTQEGLENLAQLTGIASSQVSVLINRMQVEDYLFYQFDVPLTLRTKFEDLMKQLGNSNNKPNVLALSAYIFGLLSEMFAVVEDRGFEHTTTHLNRQNNLAQSAKSFVDDYANMVTNAQQLAEMLNTSVSTLQRQFKLAYNISIGQYIKDQRLAAAAEFLAQDMSIEDVSELLGYSYRSAFERAFKNYYGYSPGNHNKHQSEE